MNYIIVLNIQLLTYILHETSQENYQGIFYQNPLTVDQQLYQSQGMMNEPKSPRFSDPYGKSKYGARRNMASSSHEYDDSDSEESQECRCSCRQCGDERRFIPCCGSYCTSCQVQQSQSNLIFVPYPYPLLISKMTTPAIATSTMMTTESTTKSGTQSVNTPDTNSNIVTGSIPEKCSGANSDLKLGYEITEPPDGCHTLYLTQPLNKDNNTKFILTSLRRTKPYWLPKYGIVPIPDRLAEKLLSHIHIRKLIH